MNYYRLISRHFRHLIAHGNCSRYEKNSKISGKMFRNHMSSEINHFSLLLITNQMPVFLIESHTKKKPKITIQAQQPLSTTECLCVEKGTLAFVFRDFSWFLCKL